MQAQEIITRVRKELVETIGVFWSDAELLELINRGEKAYLNDIRWLEDKANLDTIVGIPNYQLPSNWVSAKAVFVNDLNSDGSDNWKRIYPTNLEKMAQESPNFLSEETEKRDTPRKYYIWGRELYLYPIPKVQQKVVLFFKSKSVPLTNATQSLNTDDSLADGIEAYVLWKAWKKEKEIDLAQEAREEYDAWISKGRRWVKKQSGDQRNRIDIESQFPFSGSTQDPFNPII